MTTTNRTVAARTKSPTRSSVHVNCLCCAIGASPHESGVMFTALQQKSPKIFVAGFRNCLRTSLEINFPTPEDDKIRGRGSVRISIPRYGCGLYLEPT